MAGQGKGATDARGTEFRPDPATYWRNNAILALVLGVAAGVVLLILGNPYPWAGPLAAVLAIGFRAWFLRSEVMGEVWRLGPEALSGPGGRAVPLSQIAATRVMPGQLQLVTAGGDKHLIRYLANATAAKAAIDRARA